MKSLYRTDFGELSNGDKLAYQIASAASIVYLARTAIESGNEATSIAHGSKSLMITRMIRSRHQANVMLKALLPDADSLVGAGRQTLVFGRGDSVEKVDYNLIGQTHEDLAACIEQRRSRFAKIRTVLGDFAVDTQFDTGELKVGRFIRPRTTLSTYQQRLEQPIDVFSRAGAELVACSSELRRDVGSFADRARKLNQYRHDVDLCGRGNLVVCDGRLTLIDVDPLDPEIMNTYNPLIHDTIANINAARLDALDTMAHAANTEYIPL